METGFNNKSAPYEEAWYVFSVEPICVIDADGTRKVQIGGVWSNNNNLTNSVKYTNRLSQMHNPNSNTIVGILKSYVVPGNNNKLQLQFNMSYASADVGVYVKYNSAGSSMHTPCFFDVYARVCSNANASGITNDVYLYSVKFLNQRPRENINDSLSPSKTGNPVFSDEAKTGFLRWSDTRKSTACLGGVSSGIYAGGTWGGLWAAAGGYGGDIFPAGPVREKTMARGRYQAAAADGFRSAAAAIPVRIYAVHPQPDGEA